MGISYWGDGERDPFAPTTQGAAMRQVYVIPLTRGLSALVDEKDYPLVAQCRWHVTRKGYAAGRVNGRVVLMHRLILGSRPGEMTDHRNGIKTDNRRDNLRLATPRQSSGNTRPHRGSTSRFKGVYRHSKNKAWIAKIMAGGKAKHLGSFATEIDAAKAYDQAARELHGEFARLNLPEEAT